MVSYDDVDLFCVLNVRSEDVDLSIPISHKLMNKYDYLKFFIVYNSSTSLHTVNFRVCLGEYDDTNLISGIKLLSHSIETYLTRINECRHMSRDEILLDANL